MESSISMGGAFIWLEHAWLREKDYKTTRNNVVETTHDIFVHNYKMMHKNCRVCVSWCSKHLIGSCCLEVGHMLILSHGLVRKKNSFMLISSNFLFSFAWCGLTYLLILWEKNIRASLVLLIWKDKPDSMSKHMLGYHNFAISSKYLAIFCAFICAQEWCSINRG